MRLFFLNRFYWPDEPATAQLLTDLAEALAARGHEVSVIAGRSDAPGAPNDEVHGRVRIHRVWRTRWGRASLVGRAVDFVTFLAGACWRLHRTAGKGDIVVAMTDPPMLGTLAWATAALRGAKVIHWNQDIFPEIATALAPGAAGSIAGALLRPFRNLAWRRSAGCVILGPDMAAIVAQSGVPEGRISVIANWAPSGVEPATPEAVKALRREWNLEGRFVIAYSGNLGRVHDLEPVIETAAALREDDRIAFVFIGNGAQRASLERLAIEKRLVNVRFRGPQPRDRLSATLSLGDLHLVTLRPGCEGLVFPSKLYGIAAVGKPILFVGPNPCDVSRIVTTHRMGLAFTRDQPGNIATAIRELASDPARCASLGGNASTFSKTEGRLEQALAAWEKLLAGVK